VLAVRASRLAVSIAVGGPLSVVADRASHVIGVLGEDLFKFTLIFIVA
jgi:hypothetical protein